MSMFSKSGKLREPAFALIHGCLFWLFPDGKIVPVPLIAGGSDVILNSQAAPADGTIAAGKIDLYYASAGPGVGTPVTLCAKDENNVIMAIAQGSVLNYRIIKVLLVTTTGNSTYTPSNGSRALYVECVGGGAGGGGAASSTNANCAVGSGGGGGGYSASFITGANVKQVTVNVGAAANGGTAGNNNGTAGNSTTFDTSGNQVIANGGGAGQGSAQGTAVAETAAGAGATAGTGDVAIPGGAGGTGARLSGTLGISGAGGEAAMGFGSGGASRVTLAAAATNGLNGANYGGGGSGGAGQSAGSADNATGGNGAQGIIRIWEMA